MTRSELHQKIREFSQSYASVHTITEDLSDPFFAYLTDTGYIDSNGYFIFPKDIHHMVFPPKGHEIRQQLFYSPLQDKLRLVLHTPCTRDPFHKAEFCGVNYVYSGELKIHFPNKVITVSSGQVCLISEKVVHSYEIASNNDIIFSLQIDQLFFNKYLVYGLSDAGPVMTFLTEMLLKKDHQYNYQIFDCTQSDHMKLLFEDLFIEYLSPDICNEALLENYMKTFFIYLARSKKVTDNAEKYNAQIYEVLKYMELNSRTCSLNELAEYFNYNSKYLSQLIKDATGYGYSEYMSRIKMHEVSYYLKNTNLSIQEIAEKCGYSNRNFFYKKFKEYYKMSPLEYRRKCKKL